MGLDELHPLVTIDCDATYRYTLLMSEKLSDQIRRAILDADISRYRLATDARVDPGHLSRFVNGKAGLGLDAIDRIAEVLKLRITVGRRKEK
jgi:hypothetical protein